MSVQRKTSWLIAFSILGGAFLLSAAVVSSPEPAAARPFVKRVEVAAVEAAASSRELRFSGVLRAERRARLAFTQSGRIVARPVELGDRVVAGQLLARLDDLENENAAAGAEATLAELAARRAQAERDAARVQELVAAKAATTEEVEKTATALDALRASEASARARLQETRRRLGESRLLAPFAATVTDLPHEAGEYVGAGAPIVVLSGDGGLEVEVEVPESVVGQVAVGDATRIVLPLAGREVGGTVRSVGRAGSTASRLFPILVAVDGGEGMVAGMTAELVLRLGSGAAMAVPVEAVINPGGRRPALFRLVDGDDGPRVEKVEVAVGALVGDRVIVDGAIAIGDRVVVVGQRGLLDGEAVEVRR